MTLPGRDALLAAGCCELQNRCYLGQLTWVNAPRRISPSVTTSSLTHRVVMISSAVTGACGLDHRSSKAAHGGLILVLNNAGNRCNFRDGQQAAGYQLVAPEAQHLLCLLSRQPSASLQATSRNRDLRQAVEAFETSSLLSRCVRSRHRRVCSLRHLAATRSV
jgi:hypothetical protein